MHLKGNFKIDFDKNEQCVKFRQRTSRHQNSIENEIDLVVDKRVKHTERVWQQKSLPKKDDTDNDVKTVREHGPNFGNCYKKKPRGAGTNEK